MICSNKKCFKLELILNTPLEYICDHNTPTNERDPNNKSEKSLVLYYKFYDTDNHKKYLFFKLESHEMNSLSHLVNFINTNRNDTYHNRRENEGLDLYNESTSDGGMLGLFSKNDSNRRENEGLDLYNESTSEGGMWGLFSKNDSSKKQKKYASKETDIIFYENLKKYINDDIKDIIINNIIPKIYINDDYILSKVNSYNENIRTGAELFIVEELKNFLIKKYINKNKLYDLIETNYDLIVPNN